MALGGGTWQSQNKILPGAYINFISKDRAGSALSERGVAAAPLTLSWGEEGAVMTVTAESFRADCKKLFGYAYDAPEMISLREIFRHAGRVYCYRLGAGTKAQTAKYGSAKYPGARGNAIKVTVAANADDATLFDVVTFFDGAEADRQTVKTFAGLEDNDYVVWASSGTLAADAGTAFSGGTDCAAITGEHYQAFLSAIEGYVFNALCCPVVPTDASTKSTVALFVSFTERMRSEVGSKFQLCAIKPEADNEGVVGVLNSAVYDGGDATGALAFWTTGALAAAEVGSSLTNSKYDGELTIATGYTQAALAEALSAGRFVFHSVGGDVRVLADINTLRTFTADKGEVFADNQTVRLCDGIAGDIAALFAERYSGMVPNDAAGRAALWNDTVKLMRRLEGLRAIEDFDPASVTVSAGDKKGAVRLDIDALKVVGAMSQLYMSVIIR